MEHKIRILSTRELRKPIVDRMMACERVAYTSSDFIQIVPVQPAKFTIPEDGNTAFIFTSANAVTFAVMSFPGLPHHQAEVFCLSGQTRQTVNEKFGEGAIKAIADNAAGLAQQIIANGVYRRVAFFCGEQRRDELPAILRAAGVDFQEVVIYRTMLTPHKKDAADGILFFSPSAVESYFSVNRILPTTVCFAIGTTTAAAIKEETNDNTIIIAEQPTQEAMLHAVFNHYQLTLIEPANQ